MDNNLNDQITENSEGEEKSPSSYTDPNAGYTEAEPQAKNDNSVPKDIRHILTVKCQSQKMEPIRAELIPMGILTTSIRIAVIIPDLTRAATITITIARTIIRCRQSRWIYLHFLPENGF